MSFIIAGAVEMIRFENVSFSYEDSQNLIFDKMCVDFSVGELFALLGPSGIGKSTFIRLLSGIEMPNSGHIYIEGDKINSKRHRLGLVPQDNGLVEWLDVKSNICIGTEIKQNFDREFFNTLVEIMGISECLDSYPSRLSGGQQKRVAIARALLVKPHVLLLDEPFVSLDEQTSGKIQDLILKLHDKYKVTMILVTHRYKEALYLGERIGVLGGKPAKFVDIVENDIQGNRSDIERDEYLKRLNSLETIMKESHSV
ncbi:MAG: ATP-binding cassette domain-containing protein [Tissierellales bacterium]|jgi:ABC-type nitrate/sulfonate/bicarbonate transport system ATPase subunit|nr:ATP-binding cassette domain-containing protein [Tissierellales bacterium]